MSTNLNESNDLVPVNHDVTVPDASWSLDQLQDAAKSKNDEILECVKRLAIHVYRLGRVLTVAKPKAKHGEWGPFLAHARIAVATDYRARKLFEFFKSEAELDGLEICDAYRRAGVPLGKSAFLQNPKSSEARLAGVDRNSPDSDEDNPESESESEDEDEDEDKCIDSTATAASANNAAPKRVTTSTETKPGPKEDSFGLRLAELRTRAEWLVEKANSVGAKGEELALLLDLIEQTCKFLSAVKEELNHA